MKNLKKLFVYLLFCIFLILIFFTEDKLTALLAVIPFMICYKYTEKVSDKHFILILFILSLLIRIITIAYLDVPVMDDFKTMYEASKSLVAGNLDFTSDFYFTNFSYQLGFVFVQALFLKIMNSIFFLKIINSIVTSFIVVFIFLISRNIASSRSSRVVSLLYVLYFYPLYLNSVLTNQHLQALLSLIIIYLITKQSNGTKKRFDNPIIKCILIGLLLGISNIIRSEAIVFIVSFLFILIFHLSKNNYQQIIKRFLITLVTFVIITSGANTLCKVNHINETGFKNNAPLWKFYVGLSVENDGMYNEKDQNTFFNKSSSEQKTLLLNRIQSDYLSFPILFLKKEVITFTKSKFNVVINNNIDKNLLAFIFYFSNGILILTLLLFLLGIFPKRFDINNGALSILVILFIYFGVYLFIEVSPRYGYNLQMLIFILSSLGIDKIINRKSNNKEALSKK